MMSRQSPAAHPAVAACRVDDLPPGGVHRVDLETPVAIFNVDGVFYAIDDTCTHANASLSEGDLDGCAVECPWHISSFDLRTGKPSSMPATKAVRTHAVEVHDGWIFVLVGTPSEWAAREEARS
jgi:3-phenylpropionate/trans-cinnamate dioxygenase ferredoxin subunit